MVRLDVRERGWQAIKVNGCLSPKEGSMSVDTETDDNFLRMGNSFSAVLYVRNDHFTFCALRPSTWKVYNKNSYRRKLAAEDQLFIIQFLTRTT